MEWVRGHPRMVVMGTMSVLAVGKLLLEVWKDLRTAAHVRVLRKTRPDRKPGPPNPVSKAEPSIWEEDPSRKPKGIARLKHYGSLDTFSRLSFRPGSKLREPAADVATKKPRRPYRILSIDGGGVKGVFALRILQRLLEKCPHLISECDLLAGTSTGGLVALILAAGYTPAEGLEIYKYNLPIIFHTNVFRRLAPFTATYSDYDRMEVFRHYLGEMTLGDLQKHVVITAFRLDGDLAAKGEATFFSSGSWRPALMSNLPLAQGVVPPDLTLKAVDAAMRTSSAPTYFSMYQGYADGALVAQNPSLAALGRAYAHFPAVTPQNTMVLSIGCGFNLKEIPEASGQTTLDWGLQQWAPRLLDLLMEANQLTNEHTLRMLLLQRYHRVDTNLPLEIALDDVTTVDRLIQVADSVDLTDTIEYIYSSFLMENVDTE